MGWTGGIGMTQSACGYASRRRASASVRGGGGAPPP